MPNDMPRLLYPRAIKTISTLASFLTQNTHTHTHTHDYVQKGNKCLQQNNNMQIIYFIFSFRVRCYMNNTRKQINDALKLNIT